MTFLNRYAFLLIALQLAPPALSAHQAALTWGGEHINLIITETGARLEFDCGVGTIDVPLTWDKEGRFDVIGTYTATPRNSTYQAGQRKQHRARYTGRTHGTEMVLTVLLPEMGEEIGTFELDSGGQAHLEQCLAGSWGGEHIQLVVKEGRARLEYDCAGGTIDEPLDPDEKGNFEVRGTHMILRGGPGRIGDPPLPKHPALYHGWTDGRDMRLTVTLSKTGKEVGTFSLELGRKAHLERCL